MAGREQVQRQVERIVASPGFAGAERLQSLLRYVVASKLAGEDGRLKESVLAIEVFGRGPEYDSKVDSVVRVAAGKLRSRLAEYYADAGSKDEVLIELPKGGYVPLIRLRPPPPAGGLGPLLLALW